MSAWLESLDAETLARWGPELRAAASVVLILAATWLALAVMNRGIRRFRTYLEARSVTPEHAKRVGTLCRAFRYLGSVAITVVAGMLLLNALGISIAPILATAGVAGIAIGFGAQTLVKDYFSGFFLLLEDQIREGDVVTVAGIGGLVEEVTLRYIRLRDFEGQVHFVPNSEIKIVSNRTRDFAHSLIRIGVAYREDTDEVLQVMREVGAELRSEPAWASRILGDLEVVGVDEWADSAVMLACRFKVVGIEQWSVRREFLRRLKKGVRRARHRDPFPAPDGLRGSAEGWQRARAARELGDTE